MRVPQMLSLLSLLLLVAGCVSVMLVQVEAIPFNSLYMKGSHNSYQRDEALVDQLTYHRIRSIEVDLHIGRSGCTNAGSAVAGDWYIYDTCLVADNTDLRFFSDYLKELVAWHNANPQHEVVTVFMDLKDNLDTGTHRPADLDAILVAYLGSAVYGPADLIARAAGSTSLKQAVTSPSNWPDSATELKGKFMFIITAGQSSYASTDAAANVGKLFVAKSSASAMPAENFYIFFNQNGATPAENAFSATVAANGLMSRQYYILTTDINPTVYATSIANKCNFVASNCINFHVDPIYGTHDVVTGYPFRAYNGYSTTGLVETGNVLSIAVTSEDVWGNSDSMVFLSTTSTGAWTTQVSNQNSHTYANWGKAGVMYRQSTAADSIYFAVVRGEDANILRTQQRMSTGGSSSESDAPTIQGTGSDQQSRDFMKASCVFASGNTVCSGYGSQDGVTWVQIGTTQTFTGVNLAVSGPFASSHGNGYNADGTQTKYIFTNLKQGGVLKVKSAFTQTNLACYGTPSVKNTIF